VVLQKRALRRAFPHTQLPSSPGFSVRLLAVRPSWHRTAASGLEPVTRRIPKRSSSTIREEVEHSGQLPNLAGSATWVLSCSTVALVRCTARSTSTIWCSPKHSFSGARQGLQTPLPAATAETLQLLDHYLRWERPPIALPLFVGLKGRPRGRRLTAPNAFALPSATARHQRGRSESPRFRHTFAIPPPAPPPTTCSVAASVCRR